MTIASTPNLGLNLPSKGISNYDIPINDNFSKIDYELNRVLKKEINPEKIWEVHLGDEPNYSSPLIFTLPDGTKTVITSTWNWYINCHRLSDGQLLWRHATNAPCYGRCVAINIDNQAYIFGSSHDGTITCLDETGSVRYQHKNIYDREGTGMVSSAGSFYFCDSTKNWVKDSFIRGTQGYNASVKIIEGTGINQVKEISGVDENDHSKIWLFEDWDVMPDSSSKFQIVPKYESDRYYQHTGTISVENNIAYLYCCGFDGQLVKLRVVDNTIMWKFSTRESIEPYPLIQTVNGQLRIFITSLDKYVYSFSADGTLIFKTLLGDGADAFLGYDSDLGLLISCRDNRVYRINPSTGVILYKSSDSGSDIDDRPTVVTDGISKFIVVGNDDGYIYKFDETLEIVNRYHIGSGINSSIVVADVNSDSQQEILCSDMNSCITILNSTDFVKVGEIYTRGGIEGTPEGFIDENSKYNLIISSLDGYLKVVRFD